MERDQAPDRRRTGGTSDEWLTTEDLAERYQVPEATVRKWRAERTGPPGARFGKHLRYRLTDVHDWEAQRFDPSAA